MAKSAEISPPPPSAVRSLEICRVAPPPDSPESATQFTLPLTFFDTFWLKFPPVERIFFYRLLPAAADMSSLLPRLKRCLSLALLRYLPLAGKLTWPAGSEFPFLLYSPGDGVSVKIAESTSAESNDDNFDLLSGDGPRDAILSRAYVPELVVSGSNGDVLAIQITLFPGKGFCIGVTSHHAVLDGKSTVMFLKAWAYISSEGWRDDGDGILPEELTPSLDRTGVQDTEGIASEDVKTWMAISGTGEDSPRSLELLLEARRGGSKSDQVRGTFKLSRQDIQKLKQSAIRELEVSNDNNEEVIIKPNNLSTFVITYAYTLVCMAKAKGLDDGKKAYFGFTADCRSRLEPPLPSNYFGNCVMAFAADLLTIGELVHDGGIASAARKLVEVIRKLENGILVDAKGKLARLFQAAMTTKEEGLIGVGVAGSPRFGVYGVDFGYGRPEKVEVTSIDRTLAMSMAESGDGSGGVEVGIVMQKHEMEAFTSAFSDVLKHIYT